MKSPERSAPPRGWANSDKLRPERLFLSCAALPFLDIKNAATPPSLTAYRTARMLVTICDDDDSFVPKQNLFISFTRENNYNFWDRLKKCPFAIFSDRYTFNQRFCELIGILIRCLLEKSLVSVT